MQQTFQEQMAFKEMQRQQEKEEEAAIRKTMMAKFAEDDRIEQMNARKRRMMQLQHKHEVEKLLDDRRRQREADRVPIATNELLQCPLLLVSVSLGSADAVKQFSFSSGTGG